MNITGSCMLYHHRQNNPAQVLSFIVTDTKGSVFLSCTDTLALGLVGARNKLDRKLPNSARLAIRHANKSDVLTITKKTQGNSAKQQVNTKL